MCLCILSIPHGWSMGVMFNLCCSWFRLLTKILYFSCIFKKFMKISKLSGQIPFLSFMSNVQCQMRSWWKSAVIERGIYGFPPRIFAVFKSRHFPAFSASPHVLHFFPAYFLEGFPIFVQIQFFGPLNYAVRIFLQFRISAHFRGISSFSHILSVFISLSSMKQPHILPLKSREKKIPCNFLVMEKNAPFHFFACKFLSHNTKMNAIFDIVTALCMWSRD